jgi:glucokinase
MYIGLDVGGTSVKVGVFNEELEIIHEGFMPTTNAQGEEPLIAAIIDLIETMRTEYKDIRSIGVGFPSVVRPDGSVHHPPNLVGWGVVPLQQRLQEACKIPVALDNDANVAALAESTVGSGRDQSNFLYVTLGTGVGGCIISDNTIYSGRLGGAGEIGHIIINAEEALEPTALSRKTARLGILEEYVGRAGILRLMKQLLQEYPQSILHSMESQAMDVKDISEAAYQDDKAACECLRRTGALLAVGLSSVLAILDLHVVVVGGGISQVHPLLLDTTRSILQKRAMPTIADDIDIRLATFSAKAGITGAALLGKLFVSNT